MRAMSRRVVAPIVFAAVLLAFSAAPAAAIGFGPIQRVSSPYAWNPGKSLAATTNRLLSIWASDCPPPTGQCATDHGPRMGVFVGRAPANADPPRWGQAFRLSPGSVQAERPSIDADGATVIASYVTQHSYQRYWPQAPRVLWVRVSVDRGKHWRAPVRLSPAGGRVDYPRVAVAGGRLLAVWTVAGTGAIRFARSDDLGKQWQVVTVGTTTARPIGADEGFAGLPDIGASGANVAIAWIAADDGAQNALVSSTGGDDFAGQTPAPLTSSSPSDAQHYPAVGGASDPADPRVAIAYSTDSGIDVRVWDGATLGAAATAIQWPMTIGGTYFVSGYGPAVLPVGSARIAVAVAACRNTPGPVCNPNASSSRIDVVYRATPDGGATWETARRLTDAATPPYRTNDEPSLAVIAGLERVSFDRYEPTYADYSVWIRSAL